MSDVCVQRFDMCLHGTRIYVTLLRHISVGVVHKFSHSLDTFLLNTHYNVATLLDNAIYTDLVMHDYACIFCFSFFFLQLFVIFSICLSFFLFVRLSGT